MLGPRGTGKSTWIRKTFPQAPTYDLLNTAEALRLSKEPQRLFHELASLPAESWVIIDEVQKVPALLDEVQRLIETKRLQFILCGSSARKLKRGGANLLAGRARSIEMFPLVSAEVPAPLNLGNILSYGMLPMAYTQSHPEEYLRSYAETYLQEEIRAEALTRDIGAFARFLEVAARQNAQVTNVSAIARDAMVARPTVQGFFDILIDTLLGFWLEPWKLKRATKQIAHPKFYFFDPGVIRALSGRLPYPPSHEETGALFETFLFNEIRAYLSYSKKRYPIYFWSSPDKVEVDLFCETRKGYTAIEFKSNVQWDRKFNKGLKRIRQEVQEARTIGVYAGERTALVDDIEILPWAEFLRQLWEGKILD
ncbi:MAG: AAA family ATPase [bacterium]